MIVMVDAGRVATARRVGGTWESILTFMPSAPLLRTIRMAASTLAAGEEADLPACRPRGYSRVGEIDGRWRRVSATDYEEYS